jgi:long-chain acyl-CoA synthetase
MARLTRSELEVTRRRLAERPGLGLGNFLAHALAVYPAESRLLAPAEPFTTPWGESCSEPTLGDWGRWTDDHAARYAGLGVGRGDPVGVYGALGIRYLLHFWALNRLGALPVLVNERLPPELAARYLARIGVVGVFADDARRAALATTSRPAEWGFLVTDDDFRQTPAVAFIPADLHADDPVLITHSSGTTGMPKAVISLHGPFFHPMRESLGRVREAATWRAVSALPPAHNAAIGAAAIALVNHEELIVLAEPGGGAALAAIRRHRPGSVVAFPQTYVGLLRCRPRPEDLSSVRLWVNLGDAAHERHVRRLMAFGAGPRDAPRGSCFVDGLGSSEMGSMLFFFVHSATGECLGRCVGTPQPWVEAAVLDATGHRVPDDQPGRLGVRGPGLSAGYWNDSRLTYRFRQNGYFLTGDLVRRDAQGRFHHLDRVTDTVTTTAHGPIFTLLLEEVLMNDLEELVDCAVVALETAPGVAHVVLFAVLDDPAPDLGERAAAALAARGLPPLDEVRPVAAEDLLVGVTGKVLKAELRARLRAELAERRPAKPALPTRRPKPSPSPVATRSRPTRKEISS